MPEPSEWAREWMNGGKLWQFRADKPKPCNCTENNNNNFAELIANQLCQLQNNHHQHSTCEQLGIGWADWSPVQWLSIGNQHSVMLSCAGTLMAMIRLHQTKSWECMTISNSGQLSSQWSVPLHRHSTEQGTHGNTIAIASQAKRRRCVWKVVHTAFFILSTALVRTEVPPKLAEMAPKSERHHNHSLGDNDTTCALLTKFFNFNLLPF